MYKQKISFLTRIINLTALVKDVYNKPELQSELKCAFVTYRVNMAMKNTLKTKFKALGIIKYIEITTKKLFKYRYKDRIKIAYTLDISFKKNITNKEKILVISTLRLYNYILNDNLHKYKVFTRMLENGNTKNTGNVI